MTNHGNETNPSQSSGGIPNRNDSETEAKKEIEEKMQAGFKGSAHLFTKIKEINEPTNQGPQQQQTAMTFNKIEDYIHSTMNGNDDETVMNYEGHQLKKALEHFGENLDSLIDMSLEDQKQSLANLIGKSLSKLIGHERLISIYGSEYLVDLIRKRPLLSQVQPKKEAILKVEKPEKEFPDLSVDMSKVDLMTDANEHFIEELNKHLSKRVDNLRERKDLLEMKQKEESEKQELFKNKEEKRRGGWREAKKQESILNDDSIKQVLSSKVVDLTNITNYSPDQFQLFDKSKVIMPIEDARGDEAGEDVIPEEQLFGRPDITRSQRARRAQFEFESALPELFFLRKPEQTKSSGEKGMGQQLRLPNEHLRKLR